MDLRWIIYLSAVIGFVMGVVTVLSIQWYVKYKRPSDGPDVFIYSDGTILTKSGLVVEHIKKSIKICCNRCKKCCMVLQV